jgi:hypothetical protein
MQRRMRQLFSTSEKNSISVLIRWSAACSTQGNQTRNPCARADTQPIIAELACLSRCKNRRVETREEFPVAKYEYISKQKPLRTFLRCKIVEIVWGAARHTFSVETKNVASCEKEDSLRSKQTSRKMPVKIPQNFRKCLNTNAYFIQLSVAGSNSSHTFYSLCLRRGRWNVHPTV